MSNAINQAAKVIIESQIVIGFTGAGISTESGIPDFRTMGAFWEGFDPDTFEKEIDSRDAFDENPEKVWRFFSQALEIMEQAEPNSGHKAFARLGQLGCMGAIITQNVDSLHQAAGSENVIEFHGNMQRLHCPRCNAQYNWNDVKGGKMPPLCQCKNVLKPDVPLFGDQLDLEAVGASEMLALNAQVMLLAGTYGNIAPVNQLPLIAKDNGAVIVEVNRDKTLYTDRITDYFLQGEAGEVLSALVRKIEEIL